LKADGAKAAELLKAYGSKLTGFEEKLGVFDSVLVDIQQKMNARGGGGIGNSGDSWGHVLVNSAEFKDFVSAGHRGTARIQVKAITSAAGSGGAFVVADRRDDVVTMARRRLAVRDVLTPGRTSSGSVEYVRQTGRTNNAAVVSETVEKPESALTFEAATAPVRTIAHWIPVSRQVMDDAPGLQSLDGEMRYGLQIAEEAELLSGDGTGQHLSGLITEATAFDTALLHVGDTAIDYVLRAKTQAELADLPATFVIMNTEDWSSIVGLKDDEARYLLESRFCGTSTSLQRMQWIKATFSSARLWPRKSSTGSIRKF
jgi:HK97 family phage major capsid protein